MQQQEDPQGKPLAPVQDYPRSDMEFGGIKPKSLRREEKSSKCLVYVLTITVVLGTILLTFGSIFLRPRTPGFKFRSVQIAVENTNFGDFRFDNTTGSVSCGLVVVGEFKIPTGRAQARKTERLNVSVDVSSIRVPNTTSLSGNISSGILELSSHVKLSGKLNIMNIMKRRRHPEMTCFMKLNLTGSSVHDLTCD
ncbi:hypothetical protein E1A91_A12G253800v1 [Gossypium mustelinum]|uniref:Late embryogenesis abundant protein LEA-2 subgroup domain-containing protein n=2 Tax=Gossypium TaxID=3633 RepID=A0A5D2WYN3_GOSMU|nr:hypothetical protein ES332_A12G265600v1 [Gossypium tomentosum]TYJ06714.1 hypothetical protein E1A91_A12G253800v1 [Gossypium mustelinum]